MGGGGPEFDGYWRGVEMVFRKDTWPTMFPHRSNGGLEARVAVLPSFEKSGSITDRSTERRSSGHTLGLPKGDPFSPRARVLAWMLKLVLGSWAINQRFGEGVCGRELATNRARNTSKLAPQSCVPLLGGGGEEELRKGVWISGIGRISSRQPPLSANPFSKLQRNRSHEVIWCCLCLKMPESAWLCPKISHLSAWNLAPKAPRTNSLDSVNPLFLRHTQQDRCCYFWFGWMGCGWRWGLTFKSPFQGILDAHLAGTLGAPPGSRTSREKLVSPPFLTRSHFGGEGGGGICVK